MQGNLTATQDQQQQKQTASVEYIDAKYKYVQERRLLETAKSRLNTETMQRTMPQQSAAIRDPAEPGSFPVRPKTLLNLLLGAAGGLTLGVGLAFFVEYLDIGRVTLLRDRCGDTPKRPASANSKMHSQGSTGVSAC